jgi:hypothetical protein
LKNGQHLLFHHHTKRFSDYYSLSHIVVVVVVHWIPMSKKKKERKGTKGNEMNLHFYDTVLSLGHYLRFPVCDRVCFCRSSFSQDQQFPFILFRPANFPPLTSMPAPVAFNNITGRPYTCVIKNDVYSAYYFNDA